MRVCLVPSEPKRLPPRGSDADTELPVRAAEQLVGSLSQTLRLARRVRVFDRRGKIEPGQRRDRERSSVLVDLNGADTLADLVSALCPRPDTEIMYWMSWPDLWFEFADDDGLPVVLLGLLSPDWLRWDPHGDMRLSAPESLAVWLTKHLP
jgi:hypothetical protein